MRIIVISGFLGSGKTTFINYLLRTHFVNKQVVVLENESGSESIDGTFLRANNFNVVDLKSGCICCTLKDEFPVALKKIEEEINPNYLLIEPSGISSLQELLSIKEFKPSVIISLVDFSNYHLLNTINREFYSTQYRLSQVIFTTKEDLVESDIRQDILRDLEKINPSAFICSNYRQLDEQKWEQILEKTDAAKRFAFTTPSTKQLGRDIQIETVEIPHLCTKEEIEKIINSFKMLPDKKLARAKGFVKMISKEKNGELVIVKVDYSSGVSIFEELNIAISAVDSFGLVFWFM